MIPATVLCCILVLRACVCVCLKEPITFYFQGCFYKKTLLDKRRSSHENNGTHKHEAINAETKVFKITSTL